MKQDFQKFLGGVERNSSGHIVAAKSTYIRSAFIRFKVTDEPTDNANQVFDDSSHYKVIVDLHLQLLEASLSHTGYVNDFGLRQRNLH